MCAGAVTRVNLGRLVYGDRSSCRPQDLSAGACFECQVSVGLAILAGLTSTIMLVCGW